MGDLNSISDMGCYYPRHVTKQDVLVLGTLSYSNKSLSIFFLTYKQNGSLLVNVHRADFATM